VNRDRERGDDKVIISLDSQTSNIYYTLKSYFVIFLSIASCKEIFPSPEIDEEAIVQLTLKSTIWLPRPPRLPKE
jgi:hypothetical protein